MLKSFLTIVVLLVSFTAMSLFLNKQSFDTPRSTVYQIVTDRANQGSGVMIAPHLMVTAGHVANHTSPTKIFVNGKEAQVLEIDENRDLALLWVEQVCPCASLALESPDVDTEVIAVGFPLGMAQVATTGRFQGAVANSRVLSTTSIIFGNSGGGLFAWNWFSGIPKWELVGITVEVPGINLGFFGIPIFNVTRSVPAESIFKFLHEPKSSANQ